jgi:hypothetical protein
MDGGGGIGRRGGGASVEEGRASGGGEGEGESWCRNGCFKCTDGQIKARDMDL